MKKTTSCGWSMLPASRLPTLLSERGPARALIGSPDPATAQQRAHALVASIALGRYHALSIECAGRLTGYGTIERTPTGYHVNIVVGRGTQLPLLNLRAVTAEDATTALAELAIEQGDSAQ